MMNQMNLIITMNMMIYMKLIRTLNFFYSALSLWTFSRSPSITIRQPVFRLPYIVVTDTAKESPPRPNKHTYFKSYSSSSQGTPEITKYLMVDHRFGFNKALSPTQLRGNS